MEFSRREISFYNQPASSASATVGARDVDRASPIRMRLPVNRGLPAIFSSSTSVHPSICN
jgi:hypothetical protein